MLKAIIIDDEQDSVLMLDLNLRKYCPEVKVVAKCKNGVEGLEAIRQHKPHIVFLDIEMPYMNGFQMLENLAVIDFSVIFVTAYDKFAVKAFRFSAIDYLLKPLHSLELMDAVEKAKKHHYIDQQQLEVLREHLHSNTNHSFEKVAFTLNNGSYTIIDTRDILYIEENGLESLIHLTQKRVIVSSIEIGDLASMLDEQGFFCANMRQLVNIYHIKNFENKNFNIIMRDEKVVKIDGSRKQEFERIYAYAN